MINTSDNEVVIHGSVLQEIKGQRIFRASIEEHGKYLLVEEMCDEYFRVLLTKEESLSLLGELKALVYQMT